MTRDLDWQNAVSKLMGEKAALQKQLSTAIAERDKLSEIHTKQCLDWNALCRQLSKLKANLATARTDALKEAAGKVDEFAYARTIKQAILDLIPTEATE